jgi:hypothetical protein
MPRFEFRTDPAWTTVGEGLSLAFRQWRATATWWAIPVLLVGILSTLFYWGIEASVRGLPAPVLDGMSGYDLDWVAFFTPLIPQFVLSTLVLSVIASVARWVYYALAILGLRGGELRSGWVVGRGLRTIAAEVGVLLVSLAVGGVLFGIATAAGTGIGILLGLVAACIAIYVQVRLAFWSLMIFDGAGIVEAARASWAASAGGMLRMIGWALATVGVGFLVNIGVSIATFPLSAAIPLQSGIKAGVTEAFAVFTLFALAVLYESQLRRTMPDRASPPPAGYVEPARAWPGYAPASAVPPAWPGSAPGPVPSAAPAGTGAAAGAPAPMPAWEHEPINPDAPADWDAVPGQDAPGSPTDPDAPQPPPPPA